MTAWQGFLIKDVGSREEYEKAVQYAEALGVLRKEFRAKGCFFVSRMDQMGVYFRNQAQRRKQLMQQEGAAGPSGSGSGSGSTVVKKEGR